MFSEKIVKIGVVTINSNYAKSASEVRNADAKPRIFHVCRKRVRKSGQKKNFTRLGGAGLLLRTFLGLFS
jgi:hypothetical protein